MSDIVPGVFRHSLGGQPCYPMGRARTLRELLSTAVRQPRDTTSCLPQSTLQVARRGVPRYVFFVGSVPGTRRFVQVYTAISLFAALNINFPSFLPVVFYS